MKTNRDRIAQGDFSLWFAVLSPMIGVLLGLFGIFLFHY